MPHPLRHTSLGPLVPLLAALACAPADAPKSETAPPPSPPTAAATPAAPTAAAPSEPTQVAEATPSPKPAASPTPAPSASAGASSLRVIAVREGTIELSGWGAGLVPLLDGEPLRIAGGRPSRGAAGGKGLHPTAYLDADYTQVDFGGRLDEPSGAWLALATEEERTTAVNLVYHLQGDVWEPVDLRRGLLRAWHAFYVERDGALLAYQRWDLDHEQARYHDGNGSPEAMRFQGEVSAELGKVQPEFVQLAGAPAELPVVPATDATPHEAVMGSDGTLYALASPDHYDSPRFLLMWPPGAKEAQRVALPGLTSLGYVETVTAGEHVLVYGRDSSKAYLAIGKGTDFQQVSLDEPDRGSVTHELLGAARLPDGTLWIALGNSYGEDKEPQPLWRKPADGAWEPVPLPAFDRAWLPTEPVWGLEKGYGIEDGVLSKASRPSTFEHAAAPLVTGLRWGDGAVWVSLEVGNAYDGNLSGHPQSLLLSTSNASGAEPPVVLPSAPALHLERFNHANRDVAPGARRCRHPALVLGPASLVDERPDAVKALKDQIVEDTSKPGLELVYVGELDGERVLVGYARAGKPKQAKAIVKAVAEATGLPVTAGCRIPTVEKML